MSPNGVRALRALGAWEAVEPSCVIPSEIHMRDGLTGALLQRIRLGKDFEQRFGAPYRVCHRADLLAGLLATARQTGAIELATGHRVEGVEDLAGSPRLVFSGGTSATGRAVIAADGIRSSLRQAVAPGIAPVSRNVTLYRSLIALDRLPPELEPDCVTLWLCPGGHVVHYPVSNWRNLNIVAAVDGAAGGRRLADTGRTGRSVAPLPRRLRGAGEPPCRAACLAALAGRRPAGASALVQRSPRAAGRCRARHTALPGAGRGDGAGRCRRARA